VFGSHQLSGRQREVRMRSDRQHPFWVYHGRPRPRPLPRCVAPSLHPSLPPGFDTPCLLFVVCCLLFAVCCLLFAVCTGAAGHMHQTQERHEAQALGHWKTEECLTLCLLPQAWWADWWALATKSKNKLFKDCKGLAPAPITACEWLNRYATVTQKFATPWALARSMRVPEIVIKLALQCRCSGVLCFCSSAAALVCCYLWCVVLDIFGVLCFWWVVYFRYLQQLSQKRHQIQGMRQDVYLSPGEGSRHRCRLLGGA
jgi:hypothetical protein